MNLESQLLNSGYKTTAVSCIIEWQDKILLIKRNKNPHKGLYCPVGGKMEPYESPKQAAVREIKEETGLDVQQMNLGGVMVESSPSEYNWICFIYYSQLQQQVKIKNRDTVEGSLEWIAWSSLDDIPMPETDMPIYENIRQESPFVFDVEYDDSGVITSMNNAIVY